MEPIDEGLLRGSGADETPVIHEDIEDLRKNSSDRNLQSTRSTGMTQLTSDDPEAGQLLPASRVIVRNLYIKHLFLQDGGRRGWTRVQAGTSHFERATLRACIGGATDICQDWQWRLRSWKTAGFYVVAGFGLSKIATGSDLGSASSRVSRHCARCHPFARTTAADLGALCYHLAASSTDLVRGEHRVRIPKMQVPPQTPASHSAVPRLKVASVFGTRPEAIKLAPVIARMREFPDRIEPVEIVTAQHREMLDQVLDLFGIVPRHDLDVMRPGQDLFDVTSRVLLGLRPVLAAERPDLLLVQGDTTTVFVAALAGFYLRIPVAHLEAGLRSGHRYSPFPEEVNRKLASHLTAFHFAPTPRARDNLLAEGIDSNRIAVTGNTVIDALLATVKGLCDLPQELLEWLDPGRRTVLVTAHRRESFGKPFEDLCRGLLGIVERLEDVQLVYPVHLNPNVQEPVRRLLSAHPRIRLIEPLGYGPFVHLMDRSALVLTDSGGIQEEAPSLGKPVLVLRETTERLEAVEAGTVRLVGTSPDRIVSEASRLLTDPAAYQEMARATNPYGDGHAAERVVDAILKFDFEGEHVVSQAT